MKGFDILSKRGYLERAKQKTAFMDLMGKYGDFEVLEQTVYKDNEMCLYPGDSDDLVELFYIISGKVEVQSLSVTLSNGDYFVINQLEGPVFLTIVEETKFLYIINDSLFIMFSETMNKIRKKLDILESKDVYTEKHSTRVMNQAVMLAKRVGLEKIRMVDLIYASIFHDIGKLKISDDILLKNGRLTGDEYELIKKHSEFGCEIASDIDFLNISNIILQHHERIDGSGYPNGLKGDEICIEAKIIAIADSYDAMTSKRRYRDALSDEEAINELLKYKNTHYDGRLLDEFVRMIREEKENI